jgi:hypothetical protein
MRERKIFTANATRSKNPVIAQLFAGMPPDISACFPPDSSPVISPDIRLLSAMERGLPARIRCATDAFFAKKS